MSKYKHFHKWLFYSVLSPNSVREWLLLFAVEVVKFTIQNENAVIVGALKYNRVWVQYSAVEAKQ